VISSGASVRSTWNASRLLLLLVLSFSASVSGTLAWAQDKGGEALVSKTDLPDFSLGDLGHAVLCLVVAAILGALLAFRPRRAGGPPRVAHVTQSQIMMAIVGPILTAINRARTSIDIGIFRLDRDDVARALQAAVARGVPVRTLIAHTNRGGAKRLRKLEQSLLKTGASVRRTDDDLRRYHNKIMIVDRATLYVLGFNYTALDADQSRSFGLVTRNRVLVREAIKLFEADSLRLPYVAGLKAFLVSPVNARERLAIFLRGARKTLLLYDPKLTDPMMIRILHERRAAGVSVRILGTLGKRGAGLTAEKFPGKRLHVRAIVRDSRQAFMGQPGPPEAGARRPA
jgi:phosphatidylserine/phosphatidylglycerophosphate/cardiolipin synthase-like enzyme